MTPYEVFKMVVGVPWLAIKAALALLILLVVFLVAHVLIAGLPLNQPMPLWRAAIVRPFLRSAALQIFGLLTAGACAASSHA